MPALKQALDQSYSRCEVKERKEKEGKRRIFLAMIKAILSVLLPVSLMITVNEGLNIFFYLFPLNALHSPSTIMSACVSGQ